MYACPNFEAAQHDVFINAGPGCAMRGPGNTPGAFALEQAIDELAEKLGIDPLALRDRIDPSPVRREERRIGAAAHRLEPATRAGRRHRPDQARPRHGAVAVGRQRADQFGLRGARAARRLGRGAVERAGHRHRHRHGAGAGGRRGISGCGPKTSRCASATPSFPPGPPSHGSRTTASITPPARTAAWQRLADAALSRGGAGAGVAPGAI